MKVLYTTEEAAEATGLSEVVIRAAINRNYTTAKTKGLKVLPPLPAKRPLNKPDFFILATDLQAWAEQLPDA